jgi:hypothetical protein
MKRAYILLVAVALACSSPAKVDIEPLCVAGSVRCTGDGSGLEICLEDGMAWESTESCITGSSCIDSACQCPARQVLGADGCLIPGIEDCSDGFKQGELRCAVSAKSCGAGEVYVLDECVSVGVAACPEGGWVPDLVDGGCTLPEPSCGEGKVAIIGEGCMEPGLAKSCGNLDQPWGDEEVSGDVVYAWSENPQAGGAGTQSSPYKTLAEAIEGVPDGGTIRLGSGTYSGGLVIDKSLTIVGKCAEYVTIDGGADMKPPDSEFSGPFALYVEAGHSVDFSGFTVADSLAEEKNSTSGIFLLQATDSMIRDIRFSGLSGAAIDLHDCDDVVVDHVEVMDQSLYEGLGPYGQSGYGVFVLGGNNHEISNSWFENTLGADVKSKNTCPVIIHNYFKHRGGLGGLPPMGIWVDVCPTGATVIEANSFSTKMTHAILFDQGVVEIRRNTVVGTVTDYSDLNGPAVKIIDAEFVLAENLFLENQYAAINAVASEGTITGNRIDSSRPSDPGLKNGDGIIIKDCDPGPVIIEGNTLLRNTRNAILATGSILKVEGNYVAETQLSPSANARYGTGVNVVDGSDAAIFGNSIVGNHRLGIRFDNAYGWVEGNVIADTRHDDDGGCGGGILVGGAKSSYLLNGISRNLFSGNYCSGLFVDNSNVGTVSKNVFVGTEAKKGSMGIGAIVMNSDCDLEDNWFVDNDDSGALFHASSGSITNNVFESNGTSGRGGGLVIQDSPHPEVVVNYNTFHGNGLAGAIVRASKVEMRRNAFIENVGNAHGIGGAGAWFDPGSEGGVRANYVDGNLLAGILAYEVSDLTISVNYIANTAIGSLAADPSPVQLGEGIVAARQSFVSLLYNAVVSNKNSGIACFDSEGAIQGNTALSNSKWGLELSNSQMTIATNYYRNNGIGEQTSDGDRDGPPAPLEQWVPCTEE